jgi:hypothetical protein
MQHWYKEARAEGTRLASKREHLFDLARDMSRRRNQTSGGVRVFSAAAGAYAQQGHEVTRAIEAANQVASHALFLLQNHGALVATPGGGSFRAAAAGASSADGSSTGRFSAADSTASDDGPPRLSLGPAAAGGGGGGGGGDQFPALGTPAAGRSGGTASVDLHGQHADEAVSLLRDHLLPQAADDGVRVLQVITGKGNHGDGKSRVRNSVGAYLRAAVGKEVRGERSTLSVVSVRQLDGGGGFSVALG